MRNELQLVSELAWERPSLLSCYHKAEVFLVFGQKRAIELNEPVKALQPNVQLVAHPVGRPKKGATLHTPPDDV